MERLLRQQRNMERGMLRQKLTILRMALNEQ